MAISRRGFIRVIGGTTVIVAAGAVGLTQCDQMPSEAVEAWRGPDPEETDPRRRALAYAILAPNPHNMQPWLVDLKEPGVITLYVDRTRLLPQTDPYSRQILIGHGTFLELLDLAAQSGGYRTKITYFPAGAFPEGAVSDKPVARIEFVRDPSLKIDPLFKQILHRRSNKEPYDKTRTLRSEHADALPSAYRNPALPLKITGDPALVEKLRQIADQAMTIEIKTPRTHMESVERTRIGAREIAKHRDGIDLHGPMFWWANALGLFTREKAATPGTFAYEAGLDYAKGWMENAVSFGWMTSPANRRETQLDTGRAYARLNLRATELGVAMHPLSQALQEYPEMRATQQKLLSATGTPRGHTIQMLFRLGYAERPAPSPRRALKDLVIS
ncbi:MAG: Acg family FMN-binding oxidoreductase [Methyloligellaceae bacterium]